MSLPTMMRHIVAREPGPPEVLTLTCPKDAAEVERVIRGAA